MGRRTSAAPIGVPNALVPYPSKVKLSPAGSDMYCMLALTSER